MKRQSILCAALALLLTFTLSVPAFAWNNTINPPIPKYDFSYQLYDTGAMTSLADYTGRGLVLIDGLITCGNCHAAVESLKRYMPSINAAGVDVLVNYAGLEAPDAWLDNMRSNSGWDGFIFASGGIAGVDVYSTGMPIVDGYFTTPAIYVVDASGYINYAANGYLYPADVVSLVNAIKRIAPNQNVPIDPGASADPEPTDPAPTDPSDGGNETPVEITIAFPQSTLSLAKGKTYTLSPVVTPAAAAGYVSYQSSKPSVVSVNASGKLTAKAYGIATITARANSASATIEVTVPTPLKGFKLNRATATVRTDAPLQLSIAKLNPSSATVDFETATWKSSNSSIASVSSDGLVTAHKKGKAVITCTLNKKKAICTVKTSVPLTAFSLNKSALTLAAGKSATLKPGGYVPSGTTSAKKAKWRSSDTSVVSVNAKGVVKAKASGTATIVCTIDGITAECAVTVPTKIERYQLEVVSLINKERAKAGRSPLTLYAPLSAAATIRAQELVTHYAFERPDGSPYTGVITWPYADGEAENIAAGYASPADAMKFWMTSGATSRTNTLFPFFKEVGVGIHESGGKLYWTVLFTGAHE